MTATGNPDKQTKDDGQTAYPLPVPVPGEAPAHPDLDAFVAIVAQLRGPGGCPWDAKQTHASIQKNMVEEAFEAVAAIEEGDAEHLREELGDVLLEVVLQAQIAADAGEFTIDDVARGIAQKIVRRHPHVYGVEASLAALGADGEGVALDASTPAAVEALWDVVKGYERAAKEQARARRRAEAGLDPAAPRGILEDVSAAQPALMQAQEVSRKTAKLGFEWETTEDVWAKVAEEVAEFKAAPQGSPEAQMEFGDVLFALVNVARKEGLDAETCLRDSCRKFRRRWEAMEASCNGRGERIEDVGAERLEELWQQAKRTVG